MERKLTTILIPVLDGYRVKQRNEDGLMYQLCQKYVSSLNSNHFDLYQTIFR